MVQITAIQMSGGAQHEHITNLCWVNTENRNDTGWSTRQEMVDFLVQNPGQAFVQDQSGRVEVRIVNSSPQYVRTYADNRWTDNLLYLPGGPYAR